jgi:succinyl-CoA synthetase alpha subunit
VAGLSPIICITEFIPTFDMIDVRQYIQKKGIRLIGPNCPGVISPGKCKAGIMIGEAYMTGKVGMCSRSGTLTYEVAAMLTEAGIGQSTCAGLGGDPVPGTTFVDILKLFEQDAETKAVVLIGEIGGTFEQDAAEVIKGMKKPVVAFVAGGTAPPGRRMGHAGAIITGSAGRAEEKKKALAAAGAIIAEIPPEIPTKLREVLA